MKRMEKQRMKAARRAERSQAKREGSDPSLEPQAEFETVPTEPETQS